MAKNGAQRVTQNDSAKSDEDQSISCVEEAILRMRHGLTGDGSGKAAYEKKPLSDEVYKRLLLLELKAFEETGRLDELLTAKSTKD